MTISFFANWGRFNEGGRVFDFSNGHDNNNIFFSTMTVDTGQFQTVIYNDGELAVEISSDIG